ncbi:MAG: helicase, partial [Deltaproteobacteria bacterium]
SAKDYEKTPWARHVTIDNPNIRGLVQNLPRFIPCQPIPVVQIPGLSSKVVGFWGLWKITISAIDWKHTRIMPLFVSDDGRVFTPSARRIWDQFLSATPTILRHLDLEESAQAFEQFTCAAERSGKVIHDELLQIHREYIKKEREKILYAFTSQKKAIERIGLPQVRNYRLRQLAREKRRLLDDLDQRSKVVPEMVPIIIVRIEG